MSIVLDEKKPRQCKHVHINSRSKTIGTPYVKGYCPQCKAWVYTEKNFCICCMKRVSHKVHKFGLKTILNEGVKIHQSIIEEFRIMPYMGLTYVEIQHRTRVYHIPVKYLALYYEHPDPNQIMPLIQDALKIVK